MCATLGSPTGARTFDGLVLRLPYHPPYHWRSVMAFLSARAIPGMEAASAERYARTIEVGGHRGFITVEPTRKHALRVRVAFPDAAVLPTIVDRLRRVFDLGADPETIDAQLAADSTLAPLIAARPGLRVPGGWDGFELAVRAMLGQQITVRAAVALADRLVRRYGEPVADPGAARLGLTRTFPAAERLVSAHIASIGLPRARALALSSLARGVAANPDLLDITGTLRECVERLRLLRGVGEWTAQYIAMRALRQSDAFPAGDVALQRSVTALEGRVVNARDLAARAERWRPWRAYAAQHLWSVATPSVAPPNRHRTRKARAGRND